jgi:threonine aldolase
VGNFWSVGWDARGEAVLVSSGSFVQTSFMLKSGFASDNYSGIHPEILAAMARANEDYAPAYGADLWTERMEQKFEEAFGTGTEVFPVFNGTASNVLSLSALAAPHHAILCAEYAHIQNDECGAPERWTGAKLFTVKDIDGKLSPELLRPRLTGFGNPHHNQPRVISIAQSTELGTVYRADEVAALAELAHAHGMWLHMDGARIANAAASLGVCLRAITRDVGVDVLSFGGTKNGALAVEAVVFFRADLAQEFKFRRKQAMQLASKQRFLSVQLEALLTDELGGETRVTRMRWRSFWKSICGRCPKLGSLVRSTPMPSSRFYRNGRGKN